MCSNQAARSTKSPGGAAYFKDASVMTDKYVASLGLAFLPLDWRYKHSAPLGLKRWGDMINARK